MPIEPTPERAVRVAAAGDVHCRDSNREETIAAFAALEGSADLVLLPGDLTSHGTLEEAEILCEAAAAVSAPVIAVLGNHDWHAGLGQEMAELLEGRGVEVLEGTASVHQVAGVEVGVAGAKGFVGGFAPHRMPDFGEPSLRALYSEAGAEVEALETALRAISTCDLRIALLHYAPVAETLVGEPPEILAFMGSDRLAEPLLQHAPDLVLHGHAHAGSPEGQVGGAPVRNVSLPVAGGFVAFDLSPAPTAGPIP